MLQKDHKMTLAMKGDLQQPNKEGSRQLFRVKEDDRRGEYACPHERTL